MIGRVNTGGGTGGKLIVTAPAGVTVTVSKDGKTKTRVASAEGVAVFQGLTTGEWTVTITDGTQTATKTVTVTADYSTDITFFSATINVTYPEGSVCTATDGVTTLTAPDTSGTWECVVPNAGTWTVSCTDGDDTDSADASIAEDGQSASVVLLYELYLIKDGVPAADFFTYSEYSGISFNIRTSDGYYLITPSGAGYHTVYTNADLARYSALHIDGELIIDNTNDYSLAIWNNNTTAVSRSARIAYSKLTTSGASLDVSAYSGVYKFGITMVFTNTQKIKNLWLSR